MFYAFSNRLLTLVEMKQFELRMTALLEKQSG
jgi:hypothetical protein